MRLQHARRDAVAPQHLDESLHGGTVERHVAQHQRVRAGLPRAVQKIGYCLVRTVAIEQRRAQRAIGVGADPDGKRNPVGAPHRNDRHQAGQVSGIAPAAQRGRTNAAPCGGLYRQFPFGKVIAIGLSGALGQRAPLRGGDVGKRRQRAACVHRLRARACIPRRCTTDYRCLDNFGHFPVSPFAVSQGDTDRASLVSTTFTRSR